MMTLIAQLCALCAACALCEMILPEGEARSGSRMIGGMLMLHQVISGVEVFFVQIAEAKGISEMFEAMIR